jgi:hypothetical protein
MNNTLCRLHNILRRLCAPFFLVWVIEDGATEALVEPVKRDATIGQLRCCDTICEQSYMCLFGPSNVCLLLSLGEFTSPLVDFVPFLLHYIARLHGVFFSRLLILEFTSFERVYEYSWTNCIPIMSFACKLGNNHFRVGCSIGSFSLRRYLT